VTPAASRPFGFRVEAGAGIGMGHFMRCYALAQTCRRLGHGAAFLSAGDHATLRTRLTAARVEAVKLTAGHPHEADITETVHWVRAKGAAWLVVDGYQFDAEYQKQLREAGCRFVAIDDDAVAERYYADVVLNQNLFSERLHYRCEGAPRFLFGLRYALIRQEVLRERPARRSTARRARRLLVTFGGTDPRRQTLKVVEALRLVEADLEVRVALGPGVEGDDLRAALAAHESRHAVTVLHDPDLPGLMAWADLAISAAGSTCWELACIGVPAIVVAVADNQRDIATGVEEAGIGKNLGWWESVTPAAIAAAVGALVDDAPARREMGRRGRALVDGRGAERVVAALLN
jgi:UDP-2,4-diacetamido-2,4,6-trideoxy-beta-L-altropyranose hydrolase